jgi:formate hydrogenlyase subunit 3/multisubunit Na+/H+ antiporter MnhD subunit
MGLGLFTQESLAATIYAMIHIMLVITALFLVAGIVAKLQGSFDLEILGSLYANRIGLSILFLLPTLSLAGLPPLSGFFCQVGIDHCRNLPVAGHYCGRCTGSKSDDPLFDDKSLE